MKLTEQAIGIMILAIIATIGATILLSVSEGVGGTNSTSTLLPYEYDGIIDLSLTGANSENYSDNYEALLDNALREKFNTTKTFTVGATTYLTLPEYDSSTACGVNNLVRVYNTSNTNFTHYEVRSDIQSEAGVVFAASKNTTRFSYWSNFIQATEGGGDLGVLQPWVVLRDGSTINTSVVTDSASDGSVRYAMAYWIAAKNPFMTASEQTLYAEYAEELTKDHLQKEVVYQKNSTAYGDIYYFPFSGKNAATFGLSSNGPHYYVGYFQDEIRLWQMAYEVTGNSTYDMIARNMTALYLELSLLGDTDSDGFGVLPLNFNYNTSSPTVSIRCDGSVNTYHCSTTSPNTNPAWDDSDAPRAHWVCDALRQPSQSGELTGVYQNLSTYCDNWQKAEPAVWTSTTSCLQYYRNGTCSTTVRTGLYENSLGAGLQTYYNTSSLKSKVDEILTHLNWDSTYTYDSSVCGTGLSYRGIRATKTLGSSIGLDNYVLGVDYSYFTTPGTASNEASQAAIDAASGLGEFGNWFSILVIVGIAGLILYLLREELFSQEIKGGSY